ncbi:predicted protein [Sclerotinia sclerotiorum 1980 UF-70]|uniref:Uncharacterized protein n=1 Tax=Sclerotinia sclerotiorum (strain ATCC 18683 / 1980 / Ss-1) TaxID=665079 RepID=A7F140_SCLS1|nr:predicted protein [Sclerotinia sclerotiorum 1980 UF-70]EDN95432.1 predicted protein [Sclerotinia sclerotiorum 1980 UF-70]
MSENIEVSLLGALMVAPVMECVMHIASISMAWESRKDPGKGPWITFMRCLACDSRCHFGVSTKIPVAELVCGTEGFHGFNSTDGRMRMRLRETADIGYAWR